MAGLKVATDATAIAVAVVTVTDETVQVERAVGAGIPVGVAARSRIATGGAATSIAGMTAKTEATIEAGVVAKIGAAIKVRVTGAARKDVNINVNKDAGHITSTAVTTNGMMATPGPSAHSHLIELDMNCIRKKSLTVGTTVTSLQTNLRKTKYGTRSAECVTYSAAQCVKTL